MAATFEFSESNTVAETVTNGIANANFGSVDAVNIVPTNDPITAGNNSFEKWLRGRFSGTFTSIANLRFFKSAGTFVTGEAIKAAVDAVYAAPTATTSIVATVDIPTTEGAALTPLAPVGNPDFSGYMTLQLQTTVSTPPGAVNQKTFTLKYDET